MNVTTTAGEGEVITGNVTIAFRDCFGTDVRPVTILCELHCSNKRRGAYLSAALISFGGMWVRRLLECGAYLSAALI